jgi:hypothetical protein
MKKLINISLATVGCLLFIHALGQDATPLGPNFPCPWGFAEVYRSTNPDMNGGIGVMCDCKEIRNFNYNDFRNKRCYQIPE